MHSLERDTHITVLLWISKDCSRFMRNDMASVAHGIKRRLSPMLAHMIRYVMAHSALKGLALIFLSRFPAIQERLHCFALAKGLIVSEVGLQICPGTLSSPKALYIHASMKDAIRRKGE